MRKAVAALLAAVLLLPLCGCMKSVRLNERAIVQAIGIDFENGEYQLTLSLYGTDNSDKPTEQSKAPFAKGNGETVAQALEDAQLRSGKQLFWGQNKLLVLGASAASEGTEGSLGFFASGRQTRPNVDVVTAEGTAAELLATDGGKEGVAALIKNMLENGERGGRIPRTRLLDIAGAQKAAGAGVCTPLMRATAQSDKSSSAELTGLALYCNGSLCGSLDLTAARGVLWLRGDVKAAEIAVRGTRGQPLTMAVVSVNTKLYPTIVNGAPNLTVDCKIAARLSGEQLGGAALEQEESAARQAAADMIQGEMRAALTQAVWQSRSDVIGLARQLRKYEPEWYAQHEVDFEKILEDVTFTLNVNPRVARYGRQD